MRFNGAYGIDLRGKNTESCLSEATPHPAFGHPPRKRECVSLCLARGEGFAFPPNSVDTHRIASIRQRPYIGPPLTPIGIGE
jgi:hypothetical protein